MLSFLTLLHLAALTARKRAFAQPLGHQLRHFSIDGFRFAGFFHADLSSRLQALYIGDESVFIVIFLEVVRSVFALLLFLVVLLVIVVGAIDEQVQKARQAAFGGVFLLIVLFGVFIVFFVEHVALFLVRIGCPKLRFGGFGNIEHLVHISGRVLRRGSACVFCRIRRGLQRGRIAFLVGWLEVFFVLVVVVLIVLVLVRALATQAAADGVARAGEEGKDGTEGIGIDRFFFAVVLDVLIVFLVVIVIIRRIRGLRRFFRRACGNILRDRVNHGREVHFLRGRFRRGGVYRLRGGRGLNFRFLRGSLDVRCFSCRLRLCGRGAGLGGDAIRRPPRLFLRMPAAETLVPFNEQIVVQLGAIFPVSCHRNDRLSFRPAARGCCLRAFTPESRRDTQILLYHILSIWQERGRRMTSNTRKLHHFMRKNCAFGPVMSAKGRA